MKNWESFIQVKDSSLHGKGLFALIDIPAETRIMLIEGEIISEEECIRREEEENNVYIFWNGDHYIDSAKQEKIKYLNHGCEPNCYIDENESGSLVLISDSNIKAGDEITIDYDYDEIYEYCECSSCRKAS